MSIPHVVFLCTGNSARSQLAEALLRHHAQGRLAAHSAGTHPKGVHPLTLAVLHERGVDTHGLRSKQVAEVLDQIRPAYLIVVCDDADRNCPAGTAAGAERLFWPFPDPARATGTEEERLAVFRQVRDQIEQRILAWLHELQAAGILRQDAPGGPNG